MAVSSFLIILLFIKLTYKSVISEVTTEITSKVAFPNTNVSFVCAGYEIAEIHVDAVNEAYTISWKKLPKHYPGKNIYIDGRTSNISGKTIKAFLVDILAENTNNGTELTCTFTDPFAVETTGPAILVVATDTLGRVKGFKQPSVTYTKTTITIKWSPPWSHPVNNYTVTVTNRSDFVQTVYDIDEKNRVWTLSMNSIETECHELEVYVTAFTDVGSTSSRRFSTGFPINLEKLYSTNISVEVLQKQSGELKTEVKLKAPRHCSYVQRVLYNYSFYDIDYPIDVQQYGPISDTEFHFEGFIEKIGNYQLQLTYWEQDFPFNNFTVTKYFYTNFSEDFNSTLNKSCPRSTKIDHQSNSFMCSPSSKLMTHQSTNTFTKTSFVPSSAFPSVVFLNNTMIILIGCFGGMIILAITLCICLVLVFLLRTQKRVRQTVSTIEDVLEKKQNGVSQVSNSNSDIELLKRERRHSVPRVMATNPLYEGTSTLYSYLPDPKDLKQLNEKPQSKSDCLQDIPPQLPPRRMSIDCPGTKTGVQLSFDKQPLTGKGEMNNNDQYVPMRSASELRYAKSPVMRLKATESSGDKRRLLHKTTEFVQGAHAVKNNGKEYE